MRGTSRESSLIIVCGRCLLALLGLTLALLGSGSFDRNSNSDDVLVWVNERPITSGQFTFAAKRLHDVTPDRLNAEQRQSILNLLVDEELLLQRAATLGLYAADPGIRKALVQAVIDRVVDESLMRPVDSRQLQQFYRQHQAIFERPLRVAVEVLRFANVRDAEQAHAALLGGADIAEVGNTADVGFVSRLPSSPLPAHMLRRYLGSSLTDIALDLDQGEISDPVRRADGVYLLRAKIVNPATVRAFDVVRAEVESEYRRRARDKALKALLHELWERGDIDLNPDMTGDLVLSAELSTGATLAQDDGSGFQDNLRWPQ